MRYGAYRTGSWTWTRLAPDRAAYDGSTPTALAVDGTGGVHVGYVRAGEVVVASRAP